MKRAIYMYSLGYILLPAIVLLSNIRYGVSQPSIDRLFQKRSYENMDVDFKPLTWWHWINGNVARDGIRKDLIAMSKAGLGGVQLFDVSMYTPKGPVRYGTGRWYNDVAFAIRLCDSLGMKFYMMNSPGWSGAGGPWVTVDKSMKQLVFSELDITGSHPVSCTLPQPYAKAGFYKDVAVIAVPSGNDGGSYIRKQLSGITCSGPADSLDNVYDIDPATTAGLLMAGQPEKTYIQFRFKAPLQVNMVNIDLSCISDQLDLAGKIETSEDGVTYTNSGEFKFDDHRAPGGNFTIPVDHKNYIQYLRIYFNGKSSFKIKEIRLRDLYQIAGWDKATGMDEFPMLNRSLQDSDQTGAIAPDKVINLTGFYDTATNILKWTPPAGKWTILRFGYTTTGARIHPAVEEGSGYEIDKLDPKAVAFQFNHAVEPVIRRAGSLAGTTFKGIVFDSWEAGFQNWTGNLPAMFKKLEQFDIIKYLPVLAGRTIQSKQFSAAILRSFRDAILKLISRNYYGTMRKLAHAHHMLIFSEAEGGPMVPAFGNKYTDIPMNEFWTNGIFQRRPVIRQTVSIANILGRKIIGAESFTSRPEYGKWQNTPYKLKKIGDLAFTLGINRFIFHTYTHQPFDFAPGFTMGRYGLHFERTNTWWKYASSWINYLSRSQLLLQQGRIVSDIGYLVPEDARYKFQPKFSLPSGYNFDIIYPHDLSRLSYVDNTLLASGGASYRVLVLDDNGAMTYRSLLKLSELIRNGAIISGPPPRLLPETTCSAGYEEKFGRLVHEMWGALDGKTVTQKNYGKGCIYWGRAISDVLKNIKLIPDITFRSEDQDSLYYIHRKTDSTDIYFISNQTDRNVSAVAEVRSTRKRPEFWDPATGYIRDARIFDTAGNTTNIPLRLGPSGSVFLVFRRPLPDRWVTSVTSLTDRKGGGNTLLADEVSIYEDKLLYHGKKTLQVKYSNGEKQRIPADHAFRVKAVNGPWTVAFADGRGAPDHIVMPKLVSWTNSSDPGIRYYSGTAVYKNSFILSKPEYKERQSCLLDLGKLYDIAELWINEKKVAVIWKKPYYADITGYLKPGRNEIKILITNTWVNRLIGDASLPADYQYETNGTKFTNGRIIAFPDWLYDHSRERKGKRHTFTTWKHYEKSDPLLMSGLLGPVRLLFYDRIKF